MKEQKTVLIVDDEQVIAHLIADLLEEEGYTVRCCFDGLAALDAIEHEPPDLVVSDVMMPGLDGIAVAHQLRVLGIPTILMSAVTEHPGVPGVPFIPKPFDLDCVLAAVTCVLAA